MNCLNFAILRPYRLNVVFQITHSLCHCFSVNHHIRNYNSAIQIFALPNGCCDSDVNNVNECDT